MKIIVDAMGGDNAPQAIVQGALDAVKQHGVEVLLVGRMTEILKDLEACGEKTLPAGVEIRDASEVVEIEDDPATAFKVKKDSSLTVGMTLLKNGEGDAFVSAGSTGALLAGATLLVKRIRGIRRAAMGPVIPTAAGRAILCDCGANADCTPEYLLQFAYLGSYYAKRVCGVEDPKVGLLNIGAEEAKGDSLRHEAYPLLKAAGDAGRIHFIGNVEAHPGRRRCHRGGRFLWQHFAEGRGGYRQIPAEGIEKNVLYQHQDQAGGGHGEGEPGGHEEAAGPQ